MEILGVHLDFPHVYTCQLRKGRQRIAVGPLESFFFSPESKTNVKPLYNKKFKGRVVSGLAASQFLIRSFEVKVPNQRHIKEAVAFQAEALSYFKPEEALSIPFVEKKEKGNSEAFLFTVPKEEMKRHLEELKGLDITPDAVTTVPSALCRFARWKFPRLTEAFLIHLGSTEITCAWMEGGKLRKSHGIAKGVEELLAALHEDRKKILLKKEIEGAAKQIDLLLLKPALNPKLSEKLTELRQEIAKVYYSFAKGAVIPILFTGRADAFIHFREFLIDFSEAEWFLSAEEQKYAISIGLALEQSSPQSIQLLAEEFFPAKNWSRLGLYSLSLLSSSLFLSLSVLIIGMLSIFAKQQQMLSALQTSSQKPLLKGKTVEEKIDGWIETIETNNEEYPYLLQAPRIAEVLAWLSMHPLLAEAAAEGDPLDLKEMNYKLLRYPTIQAEKTPYEASVEMRFNFKNSIHARKFHAALREGDELVDPHAEMDWDVLNDGYRASFHLKNRRPK